MFLLHGKIELHGCTEVSNNEFVEKEIFFYDLIEGELRFQTKLHERAAKELFAGD